MSIRGRKAELEAGNALGCARLLRDRLRMLLYVCVLHSRTRDLATRMPRARRLGTASLRYVMF